MVCRSVASRGDLIGESPRVPVDVTGPREHRGEDAHRCALGKGGHHAGNADARADVSARRDDRLHGLSGALGAEVVQHEAVLTENAGVLAKRRGLVLPVVDLADGDLEPVLRLHSRRRERRGERHRASERHRRFACHLLLLVVRLRLLLEALAEVLPEALLEVLPNVLLEVLPRAGNRPASASRMHQYSQVRPTTLGIALIEPASLASPLVSGTTLPSSCAWSWYSALRHMKIVRDTSSRKSLPTTVAP
jgi:hypothetical protein